MSRFSSAMEVEAGQPGLGAFQGKAAQPEPLHCPKCQTTFFEQVECRQYVDDHGVILGQPVPAQGGAVFYMLRCLKCTELLEPRLLRQARDMVNKSYDQFVAEMTSEAKSTVKVEKV